MGFLIQDSLYESFYHFFLYFIATSGYVKLGEGGGIPLVG